MKAQPLLLDHFDAVLGTARRKDGTEEAMVFLTMHVRNQGNIETLPIVWVPPVHLHRLVQTLQELQELHTTSSSGTAGKPPSPISH